MSDKLRVLFLFSLLVLSGFFAGAIVWLSPDPLPMAHTQLLTASIALFSASGYALVRMLHPAANRKKPPIVLRDNSKTHHAPSIEGPDAEVLPPKQVTKQRDAAE
jgi:hypothetical protein